MANEEHLAQLRKGVNAWSKWRGKNTQLSLNLSQADLCQADLYGADLSQADLSGTDLRNADLRNAALSHAVLRGADLGGATLREADLRNAALRNAALRGADLRNADLRGTDLSQADLSQADLSHAALSHAALTEATFTGVFLYETVFVNVNLATVRGLDSCRHIGPSTIDHRTLLKSGPLPLVFLRGCGLPDALIEYLPSLLNVPLQFHSCFISYSSADQDFAERLYADLQNKGVRCWFAPEDMKIGDEFRSRIDQAIHLHDRLLLILSEHSVTSRWVQKEVETAFDKEGREQRLVLFPVRLDEAVMQSTVGWAGDIRRQRHIGDFTRWKEHDAYQKAFSRLLRDLKAETGEEQKKATP